MKLGEVCDFEGGAQPPKSQFIYEKTSGYVRFLQIRDFADDNNITFIPQSKKNRLCKESDILIGRYGASVGKVLTGKAGAYNVALIKTIPNLGILNISWFYHYLISDEFQSRLLGVAERSAQAGFSKEDIFNFPIPIPPLHEQTQIVGILDGAFGFIATTKVNTQRNLKNARLLFESYLNSAVSHCDGGYRERKLSQVCAIASTLVDPRNSKFLDLTHVGAGNIESQIGTLVNLMTAREEGLISGKFLFDQSMVLYSKIRPYLMKVARPNFSGLCSADIYPLTPIKNEITRDYLFYLLLSKSFTDYAIQGSVRAGMPKVNREHMFEFLAMLPNLPKQEKIAANLDSILYETQRLASVYERKLTALDALKASLLHQALSGELTKRSVQTTVIPFPTKVLDITITDLHAGILAIAYDSHERNNRQKHFGHVKAEKIAHMVEAHLGIDLDRSPIKDAAGPNDYPHQQKVEHRARKAGYFDFKRAEGAGYQVKKLRQFDALITRTRQSLGHRNGSVDELLALMLPMTTQQAEICATIHAAWNNLLFDGQTPTDEEIVYEARENWHPAKLNIPRDKFFAAIEWLKEKKVVPTGRGKKVAAKTGTK